MTDLFFPGKPDVYRQKFLSKHVLQTQRFRRFFSLILYLSATIKTIQ